MMNKSQELGRIGELHEMVRELGRDKARRLVTRDEGFIVDKIHDYLSDESNSFGITYSGFCVLSFPHRCPSSNDDIWTRTNGPMTLLIEPGAVSDGKTTRRVGIPFGARARLIMLYLQTQAILHKSPEVEIGRSMNNWLERMGIPIGGNTYRQVKEQANRISRCKLSFQFGNTDQDGNRWEGFENDGIVKNGMSFAMGTTDDPRQGLLWNDTIRLTDTFYRQLEKHAVPIDDVSIRGIMNQSLAIDIYIWLAYRLHVLSKPCTISWVALKDQFGSNYSRLRAFRENFINSLKDVITVYPAARVEPTDVGLKLFPSPPAIREKTQYPALAYDKNSAAGKRHKD